MIYIAIFNPDSKKIDKHIETARSISRVGSLAPFTLTGDVVTKEWVQARDVNPEQWPRSKKVFVHDVELHTDADALAAFDDLGKDKLELICFDETYLEDLRIETGDVFATDVKKAKRRKVRKDKKDRKVRKDKKDRNEH